LLSFAAELLRRGRRSGGFRQNRISADRTQIGGSRSGSRGLGRSFEETLGGGPSVGGPTIRESRFGGKHFPKEF